MRRDNLKDLFTGPDEDSSLIHVTLYFFLWWRIWTVIFLITFGLYLSLWTIAYLEPFYAVMVSFTIGLSIGRYILKVSPKYSLDKNY